MSDVFVYLIRSGNAIKIGSSASPENRCRELATGSPTPPELLATFPGGRQLEKRLHHHFADKRQHLEWFALSNSDCAEIARLVATGELDASPVPDVRDRATHNRRYQSALRGVLRQFRQTDPDTYKTWLAEALAEEDAARS